MAQTKTVAPMPYAVQVALVDAVGKVFWFFNPFEHFLRSCGIPRAVIERCRAAGGHKYGTMREVLAELDAAGIAGRRVEEQLVRALVSHPIDTSDGVDVDAAREAQARLRAVAEEHGVLRRAKTATNTPAIDVHQRRMSARERRQHQQNAERRSALYHEFSRLASDDSDAQSRGYRLEQMLGELAQLDGLRWTPPFRKGTVTQTDGMITSEGARYLVEARWRVTRADAGAIAALVAKARRHFINTRGLFLSVAGFRPEVVREMETGDKNVILMSGQELMLVLEGRFTLLRALELKVDEAAKRGHVFYDLARAA